MSIENKEDYVSVMKTLQFLSGKVLEQDNVIKKQNEDYHKLKQELLLEKNRLANEDYHKLVRPVENVKENLPKKKYDHILDAQYNHLHVGDHVLCRISTDKDHNNYYYPMIIKEIFDRGDALIARTEADNGLWGAAFQYFEMIKADASKLPVEAIKEITKNSEVRRFVLDKNGKEIFIGDTVRVSDYFTHTSDTNEFVVKDFSKMFGKDYTEFGNGHAVIADTVEKVKDKNLGDGYVSLLNPNESWMTDEQGNKITMADLAWVKRDGVHMHIHKIKSIDFDPAIGFIMTDQTDTPHRSCDFKKWVAK